MNAGEQTNCSAQTVCTDVGLYNGAPSMARHRERATQPKQSLGKIGFGLASIIINHLQELYSLLRFVLAECRLSKHVTPKIQTCSKMYCIHSFYA